MKKTSGNWLWTDDTQKTYMNWADDKPDSSGQCGCLSNNHDLRWSNLKCDRTCRYVCKFGRFLFYLRIVFFFHRKKCPKEVGCFPR